MKKLKELRERRAAALEEAKAITALVSDGSRDLTDDERTKLDTLIAETKSIKADIETLEADASRLAEIETESRSNPVRPVPVAGGSPHVDTDGTPNVMKSKSFGFETMGHFAFETFRATKPGRTTAVDKRLETVAAVTGMSFGVGTDGGFLVPPQFSTAIWDGMQAGTNNLLSMTNGYTIEGESLTLNANAETSRARGSQWGAGRAYWIAEADQITHSRPKVRQIKLEPKELAVLTYVTDKLLNNSPIALGQFLTTVAASLINFEVGDAIIEGNGSGKPTGILSSGCVVEVSKQSGQVAATIVPENIVKMWARLHANSRANAVWFINQDCEPSLQTMTLGLGTAGLAVYMPPGGLSQSPYATLMGRPVVPIEFCSTLGTVGDIILADMSAYATGTRGGIDSAMSMHLRFDYAETAFRFMFAVDGASWLASAITPFKGTNTLSPFVTLATRA